MFSWCEWGNDKFKRLVKKYKKDGWGGVFENAKDIKRNFFLSPNLTKSLFMY